MNVTHSLNKNMQGEIYLVAHRDNGSSLPFSPEETKRVKSSLDNVYHKMCDNEEIDQLKQDLGDFFLWFREYGELLIGHSIEQMVSIYVEDYLTK